MKILCPNCSETVKLNDLEDRGEQSEYCGKCKTVVYATYEETTGGRKVWNIHFEKPPEPKKKPPERSGGGGTLALLVIAALVAITLYKACPDLNILRVYGP